MTKQMDLFSASNQSFAQMVKEEAINRVMTNPATPESWKEAALSLAEEFLRGKEFFIALDIRAFCENRGLSQPHHNRVWGGIIQRLHKLQIIRPTDDFRAVDDAPSHCAPRRIWKSLLYGGHYD